MNWQNISPEENQQFGQKEENWQKSVIAIFKQIPSVCIRSFLSALLLCNIQNELVSSVMSSHGMHRNTGSMGPNAGSWHWTSRGWCGTSNTKAIQELQLEGHQWLWLGPRFLKPGLWACDKEGLSSPGPVSLPGAALKYSRLTILCCTYLAVLKSISFLKALCAQGSASILNHPRMHQVNSPFLLPVQQHPNPAGGLCWGCCKEMISIFWGQWLQEKNRSTNTTGKVFMGWRMFFHVCSLEYSAPSCPGCDTSSAPWCEQLLQPSTATEPHPEHLGRKAGGGNSFDKDFLGFMFRKVMESKKIFESFHNISLHWLQWFLFISSEKNKNWGTSHSFTGG